jgi:hypothetical protein
VHEDVRTSDANYYAIDVDSAGVWQKMNIRVFPSTGVCGRRVNVHVESVFGT